MDMKSLVFRGITTVLMIGAIAGCHRPDVSSGDKPSCSENPYLMKYHCSITDVQQNAENGSADAQYALGYMYYYGINTVQDRKTAELWIQRAAAQGQPLAQKAWNLIHSGNAGSDFHETAMQSTAEGKASVIEQQEPTNVAALNAETPKDPITNHLPAYPSAGVSQDKSVALASRKQWEQDQAADDADPRLSSNAPPVVASVEPKQPMTQASNTAKQQPVMQANNTDSYTIQVMGSAKLEDVTAFMNSNKLADAKYYQTTRNGAPWYILTYGRYNSQNSAQLALQQMPKSLLQYGPWVKSQQAINAQVDSKVLA